MLPSGAWFIVLLVPNTFYVQKIEIKLTGIAQNTNVPACAKMQKENEEKPQSNESRV